MLSICYKWSQSLILTKIMLFSCQMQELQTYYWVINDLQDFAGPWHVQETDISPARMTEINIQHTGHDAGQDMRAEREAERFSLVRVQRAKKIGLGLSRGSGQGRLRRKYWDMIGYFTWHQKTTRPRDFYSVSVRLG